jgi:ABC-2 type transport system permease protein
MRNMWTIARREFRQYFTSPLAYIVALLIFLVMGVYFVLILYQSTTSVYYSGSATPPGTADIIGLMPLLFMFAVPALTMRLLADEHRTGTLELLLTAPIRDWELILGKWLGAFLFMLAIIVVSLIFPIILNSVVDPGIDQGIMLANYVGIILVVAAFLAIGTAISALFNNQFAALFATMVALFLLWYVIGWPAYVMTSGGEIFTFLSMSSHYFNNLSVGLVTLSDIVYYLSLTTFGLTLGTVATEMRRWQ